MIGRHQGRPETERRRCCKDVAMAENFCRFTPLSRALAGAIPARPLTLVLPAKRNQTVISEQFLSRTRHRHPTVVVSPGGGGDGAGTVSGYATSANRSGEITPPTVDLIVGLW